MQLPIYKHLLRPIFFKLNPELAHDLVINFLGINRTHLHFYKKFFTYNSKKLMRTYCGLNFKNPIGLAAGLDKDGLLFDIWGSLGFGFAEIGTITAEAQAGNPKPRLFRYPEHEALVNRMGFNSPGANKLAANFQKRNLHKRPHDIPVGINIGKTKIVPLEKAAEDYKKSISKLHPFADYFTINISSPNTPDLRKLQSKSYLNDLLSTICETSKSHETQEKKLPLFVKIAPDLSFQELDDIMDICLQNNISGIIAGNTTTDTSLVSPLKPEGGLSGKPLFEKSTNILKYLREKLPSGYILIASGGIRDTESLMKKIDLGANLLQIYTAYIYKGPCLPKLLSKILAQRNF